MKCMLITNLISFLLIYSNVHSQHNEYLWSRGAAGSASHKNYFAVSNDGRYLASFSDNRSLRIANTETGNIEYILFNYTYTQSKIQFTPDDNRIIHFNNPVRIFDIHTGMIVDTIKFEHGGKKFVTPFNNLEFSIDANLKANRIASFGNWEGESNLFRKFTIWDIESGELISEINVEQTDTKFGIKLSPDGKTLAISTSDICLWDVESGQLKYCIEMDNNRQVIKFSPDGKYISTKFYEIKNRIKYWYLAIWDMVSKEKISQFSTSVLYHDYFITESNKLVYYDDTTKSTTIRDIETGKIEKRIDQDFVRPNYVYPIPNSNSIIMVDEDYGRSVRINLESGEIENHIFTVADEILDKAFSNNAKFLATVSPDQRIMIYETSNGEVFKRFQVPLYFKDIPFRRRLHFSWDDRLLSIAGDYRGVYIYDIYNSKNSFKLVDSDEWIMCQAFLADCKHLVVADKDCNIRIWNLESRTVIEELNTGSKQINAIASVRSDVIVAYTYDSTTSMNGLIYWNYKNLMLNEIIVSENSNSVNIPARFSRNGKYLIRNDLIVNIDEKKISELTGNEDDKYEYISNDGKYATFISTEYDEDGASKIKLYNVAENSFEYTYDINNYFFHSQMPKEHYIYMTEISPDNRFLSFITVDQSLYLLATDLPLLVDNGRVSSIGENLSLYPNPTSDRINLNFDCRQPGTADLFIVDILGNKVFSAKREYHSGENTLRLNIEDLVPGVYFLRFHVENEFYNKFVVVE